MLLKLNLALLNMISRSVRLALLPLVPSRRALNVQPIKRQEASQLAIQFFLSFCICPVFGGVSVFFFLKAKRDKRALGVFLHMGRYAHIYIYLERGVEEGLAGWLGGLSWAAANNHHFCSIVVVFL